MRIAMTQAYCKSGEWQTQRALIVVIFCEFVWVDAKSRPELLLTLTVRMDGKEA